MFQAKHKLSMLIASSDGNLTRKEIHKTLKAVEVNVHMYFMFIYATLRYTVYHRVIY